MNIGRLMRSKICKKEFEYMFIAVVVHIFNIIFEITKFIALLLFIKVCITYLNKNK